MEASKKTHKRKKPGKKKTRSTRKIIEKGYIIQ